MQALAAGGSALDALLAAGIRRVQQGAPGCSARELFLSALQQRPAVPGGASGQPSQPQAAAPPAAAAAPDASPRVQAEAEAEAAQHALRIAAVAEHGRRGAVFSFPLTPREGFIPVCHAKSAEATAAIGAALRNNLLFAGLAEDVLALLEGAAEPRVFPPGSVVQQQGQPGAHFYLITQGLAQVEGGGRALMTLGPGGSFGEVALLYAAVSETSVVALTELSAWCIDRPTFLHTTIEAMQRKRELYGCVACGSGEGRGRVQLPVSKNPKAPSPASSPAALTPRPSPSTPGGRHFLRHVPLLAHLSEESIGRLADALQHVHVAAGETVVAEGDESSGRCFIVEQGALRVGSAGDPQGGYALGVGDCFGGEALRADEVAGRQPASVVALEDARLLVMDRATALRLVFAGAVEEEAGEGGAQHSAGVEEEGGEEEEEVG